MLLQWPIDKNKYLLISPNVYVHVRQFYKGSSLIYVIDRKPNTHNELNKVCT